MAAEVQLIVGLGNPGPKYQNNRHNIGFMVLDELARQLEMTFRQVGPTYLLAKGKSSEGVDVHLMKPLTYMNLSGEALLQWMENEKMELSGMTPAMLPGEVEVPDMMRPFVVCDDLALPLGSLRLRAAGSSGGQNGLGSIIDCIGGGLFPRMRLGVAGGTGQIPPEIWPDYVLADFPGTEAQQANDLVNHAVEALKFWLVEGLEKTISRYNRRIKIEEEP